MARRRRLATTIEEDTARLRRFIAEHGSAEGAKLPPEPKLCELLGVRRGRLRTILQRVEDEGLIWRHVGRGTFAGSRQLDPGDSGWSSQVSLDNFMEARMLLEPQLAAQAAMRATAADIASLEECVAQMQQVPPYAEWTLLDHRLHRKVAEAAHNVMLLLLYDTLRNKIRFSIDARMRQLFDRDPSRAGTTNDQHRELVDAIRTHDPERAEASMKTHLASVRVTLFGAR